MSDATDSIIELSLDMLRAIVKLLLGRGVPADKMRSVVDETVQNEGHAAREAADDEKFGRRETSR